MIKIITVEDDDSIAKQFDNYITRYGKEHGIEFAVTRYTTAEEMLEKYNRNCQMLFMDIKLPGLDGMSAIRELRKKDGKVMVIFMTSLAQYAVSGYEVGAFDFVVKPVSYEQFALKMQRALPHIKMMRPESVMINSRQQGAKVVDVSDIKYVEIWQHTITWHTTQGDLVSTGSLKSVREQFENLPFELCNQCYLVNLNYVEGVNGNMLEVGGDCIKISEPRRKAFLARLADFLAQGGGIV